MKSAGWAKASDEGEESGQGKVFPGRRPPANSDLVGLQRDRIDNLNGGVLGVDLLGKPIAGLLVTVGEHDGAGGGLKGELEEFFAIGTAKRSGLGTIIEQVRVGARILLPVPVPTWVFGEWRPPEERPWRMHAAKLVGTPFETEAVRQEAARRQRPSRRRPCCRNSESISCFALSA